MNKPASAFAVVAVTTSVIAVHLWLQLREERAVKSQPQAAQTTAPQEQIQQLPEVRIIAPDRD